MAVKATTKNKSKRKKKKIGRPTLGNWCPLLACGKTYPGHDGWRIVFADEGVLVHIKQEHIERAMRGVESECVVALAFADFFGPDYDISVGVAITKVISQKDKVELRIKTPPAIGRVIDVWDHNKGWKLPAGIYRFSKYSFPAPRKPVRAVHVHGKKGKGKGASICIKNSKKPKKQSRTTIRDIVRNARVKVTKKAS